ncbi:hypothetical protein D9615_004494 [Tricholomella constricta]|uniref:Uncharacterized protein n=1 Tax=Tricholomella constricta TaxID=117010 RepID=A0A8H5M4I2_9AGAR|nr:hypothetical protein D9615_004494 [Tricholomella constricta]
MAHPIRLVTFDVLYTLIVPRLPIHVQYSRTFEPYLGVLDPVSIRRSFRVAYRSLEVEQPVYANGSQAWWSEVIRRTALGAGADQKALDASLPKIVPRLLHRFSSKEGYRAFEDAIPTVHYLQHELNIQTAVVSNADARIHWFTGLALQDLGFPASLDPIVLSQEAGIEKPSPEIFLQTLSMVNSRLSERPIIPEECLHVGDEVDCDYDGALAAGMKAFLLRRASSDGEPTAHKGPQRPLDGVQVVEDLDAVTRWLKVYNGSL